MKNITLIIPAKSESESLPIVLNELKKYKYNINVVLHESDLKTINSINNYDLKIIYQKNKGYGDALIEGINQCSTEYFCIFNADGSFDPKEISHMFKKLNLENLDFIFGSRYEKNAGSHDDTIITLLGNYIFSFIGKFFFKLTISDILYTFLIGKTNIAKKISLISKDFSFCVEFPIKLNNRGYKLGVYNCFERRRIAGKKKVNAFRDGMLILITMIKLYFTIKFF